MKKISIKMKVTLWYTGLIAIILALVLTFVFTSSDKLLFSRLEGQVKENVDELVEELNDKHGYLDDDDREYYDDGVYISIYDEQGNYVEGNTPTDFIEDGPFQTKVRTMKINNQEWIIYDVSKDDGKGNSYWIRGIAPLNQISSTLSMIIVIACVSFPFFILLDGGSNIIDVYIRYLRKKIDSGFDKKLIHTVRGAGYVLRGES